MRSGWGVLAGRVTAIAIGVWAASSFVGLLTFSIVRGQGLVDSALTLSSPIVLFALAIVLWRYADRFLPDPPGEGEVGPSEFACVAVATLMAFAALMFVRNALEHVVQATSEESLFKPPVVVVLLEFVLCALSVVALVSARRVSTWLLR